MVILSNLHWWYITSPVTALLSAAIGWELVQLFGQMAKNTDKLWKLTLSVFLLPLSIYLALRLSSGYFNYDVEIADSFAIGIITGIVIKLSSDKPIGPVSSKLIAYDTNGKHVEIILDSLDILVGEARNQIADAFRVQPASRVLIETGKGGFIQDLNKPLLPRVDDANNNSTTITSDFFGSKSIVCYVKINDEDEDANGGTDRNGLQRSGGKIKARNIMAMLNPRIEAKYGEDYLLNAKYPSSRGEVKAFHTALVDKFLAATLNVHATSSSSIIHVAKWQNLASLSRRDSETQSEK